MTYLPTYLPSKIDYFESEWSEFSFPVAPNSICAFAPDFENVLYVLSTNLIFSKYVFNNSSLKSSEHRGLEAPSTPCSSSPCSV